MTSTMVKNVKTSKPVKNQRVTDFFARKAGPSQPTSSPSRPAMIVSRSGHRKTMNAPPRADQEVISISSTSHISISSDSVSSIPPPKSKSRSRMFMDAVEIVSPPRRPVRTSRMAPPAMVAASSLKRSHSPEIQLRPSTKRKKVIFDDEIDDLVALPAIYVDRPSIIASPRMQPSFTIHSTPSKSFGPLTPKENTISRFRPTAAKKAHVAPVQEETDVEELVPSSQSDEQELAMSRLAKRDLQEVQEAVSKWRVEAVGIPGTIIPGNDDWNMNMGADVDEGDVGHDPTPYLATSPNASEAEVSAHLRSASAPVTATNSPVVPIWSPSLSHLPDSKNGQLPTLLTYTSPLNTPNTLRKTSSPSPVPRHAIPLTLSPKSKTAQIIAQIKANAYAATVSSPDESGPNFADFKDELEESSDEDQMDLFSKKGAYKAISSTTRPTRNSPRDRRTSPTSLSRTTSSSATISSHYSTKRARITASSKRPAVLIKPAQLNAKPTKRPKSNPLDMLLREKKNADKRGNGVDALKTAEDVMADEQAASEAVKEGARIGWGSEPPNEVDDDDEGPGEAEAESGEGGILDEKARERLLGSKRGKVVGEILIKDMEKEKDKLAKDVKVSGVSFWESDVGLQIEDRSESLGRLVVGDDNAHPMLVLLKGAVDRGDTAQAKLLLNPGIFANLPSAQVTSIVPWLFLQALSPHETPLSLPSLRVLSHLGNSRGGISFALVLCALARLGASRATLGSLHWIVGSEDTNAGVDVERRVNVLYRLVRVLSTASLMGSLSNEDIPDILLSLLLIAIDPTTPPALQRELIIAIDTVCLSVGLGADVIAVREATICTKLLKFACELTPVNKTLFLSFLSGGGSCRTKRIARWISHGLLTGRTDIPADKYTMLPSLNAIITLLSPAGGSLNTLSLQSNSTTTDYEDLGYHVDILGVALSDIDAYVTEERIASHLPLDLDQDLERESSPRKIAHKPLTLLEMVRNLLEVMHGKIVDTRAAHLDRSRTKAALQRLSMRIYYQRLAALKLGTGGKRQPRNLDSYFKN